MTRIILAAALAALAGCASAMPVVVETVGGVREVSVRFNPETSTRAQADARAQVACNGPASYVSTETRFDGFAYLKYRCAGG